MKEAIEVKIETEHCTSLGKHGTPSIECGPDHVIICGRVVPRPETISPSQWLRFWEHLSD